MGKRAIYWRTVWDRSWTAAFAAGPWSSGVRVAAALATVAAAGALGWATTGQMNWTVVAALAGGGVVTLGVLLHNVFWVVPADMAAESAAREAALSATLETFNPAEPDASLEEAIGYIQSGAWSDQFCPDLVAVGGILAEVRTRAHLKRIQVFGQVNALRLHQEVPPDIWERVGVDLERFWNPAHEPTQTEKLWDDKNNAFRYLNLRVVRAQIEREWRHDGS